MSDIQELIKSGADTVKALDNARHAHVAAVITLAKADQNLTLAGALAENRVITAAGGEKALGANVDARKRALIIALSRDEVYQKGYAHSLQALSDAKLAQATVATLENTLGLLKAALYAGISRE